MMKKGMGGIFTKTTFTKISEDSWKTAQKRPKTAVW
jgi:hypothetical protein